MAISVINKHSYPSNSIKTKEERIRTRLKELSKTNVNWYNFPSIFDLRYFKQTIPDMTIGRMDNGRSN